MNLIVKAGKPHTTGEPLIMNAVSVVFSAVMNQSVSDVTYVILLIKSSVSRRIGSRYRKTNSLETAGERVLTTN